MANLPSEEIMRQMAKMAVEKATEALAVKAIEWSKTIDPEITGAEALRGFARAIRSNNEHLFPTSELDK